jgi:hypothetical protein
MKGWPGYTNARSPIEKDIMSTLSLVGHGSMAFDSIWVDPMNIMMASMQRVLGA